MAVLITRSGPHDPYVSEVPLSVAVLKTLKCALGLLIAEHIHDVEKVMGLGNDNSFIHVMRFHASDL